MIAKYKTRHGASRYAAELQTKWPSHRFEVVPGADFKFNIRVYSPNRPIGSPAILAARRPRNFAKAA
jgi:hypothetical protein